MLKCSHCKRLKEDGFFSKDGKRRHSWCKKCKRPVDKEYQRKRRTENPGLKAKEYRIYREKYPEKVRAQQLLNAAIVSGKIKKQPCEKCGKGRVHAHHDDYSKPYSIRWLCPVHHKEVH